jgi:two-component system, chemotaxis family, sensor kinase CheA
MSNQGIDKEELSVFLDEMEELHEILEEDIIKLEKESGNPSLLAEIFRAAHTLKGSAAAMGFTPLSKLAHSMETVFDGVRNGRIGISITLIDTFLQCTDTIRKIKDEITEHCEVRSDIQRHLPALESLLEQKKEMGAEVKMEVRKETPARKPAPAKPPPPPVPTPTPTPAPTPRKSGRRKLYLKVEATPDCQMLFAKAFQVLTFLSEIGDVIESSPSEQEIESEARSFPLRLLVSTAADDGKISEVLGLISSVVLAEAEERDTLKKEPAVNAAPIPEEREKPAEAENAPEEVSEEEPILEEAAAPPAEAGNVPEEPESSAAPIAGAATAEKSRDDEDAADKAKKIAARSVRVNVERVDAIMDLVGELVINRTRLTQLSRTLEAYYESSEISEHFNETSDNIELITSQLQEHIMKARLLPIENVFNKFPRMVRDLSKKFGKKIELVVKGKDTELDRSVLEQIGDPLMHIMRNSIDHGIEAPEERERTGKSPAGKIQISASHVEDHILIVVEDDGRGIDPRKLLERARKTKLLPEEALGRLKDNEIMNLVFTSGFSTSETVSEISGRGVGMDVVRTNIEKLNGSVSLDSKPGAGTKVIIKLPLTLAIIKSLLVTVGRRIFAIPLVSVMQTLRIEHNELHAVKGKETILFRDNVLPLLRLDRELCLKRDSRDREPDRIFIVVVSWSGNRAGIVVDTLIGDQDIVIRPLGEYVGEVPGISGAAILGDGSIALIVDIGGLVKNKMEQLESAAPAAGSN